MEQSSRIADMQILSSLLFCDGGPLHLTACFRTSASGAASCVSAFDSIFWLVQDTLQSMPMSFDLTCLLCRNPYRMLLKLDAAC